jgi:hypothetical protein
MSQTIFILNDVPVVQVLSVCAYVCMYVCLCVYVLCIFYVFIFLCMYYVFFMYVFFYACIFLLLHAPLQG